MNTTNITQDRLAGDDADARERGRGRSAGGRGRALAVAVSLVAVAVFVSLAFGVPPIVALILSGAAVDSPAVLLASLLAGQAAFALVAYVYVRRWLPGVEARVPTRREFGLVGLAVVAMVALANGLYAAAASLGLDPPTSVVEPYVTANPTVLLAMAVLSLLVVGPAEELLFRGAVQGRLRRAFGPVGSVAGASLLFGSVHLLNFQSGLGGVIFGALVIAAVGAVLGALYERTGNLAAPALAHGVYNAALLAYAYAVTVGLL